MFKHCNAKKNIEPSCFCRRGVGVGWRGLAWVGVGWRGLAWVGVGWRGLARVGAGWLVLTIKRSAPLCSGFLLAPPHRVLRRLFLDEWFEDHEYHIEEFR